MVQAMGRDIKGLLKSGKARKILVFTMLGVLFAASLYLIFAPYGNAAGAETSANGINATVPQATEGILAGDKMEMYESGTEDRNGDVENAIATLSGLHEPANCASAATGNGEGKRTACSNIDRSVEQYKETAETLSSFYTGDTDYEKEEMREEIERLNKEIRELEEAGNDEDSQLALLEKSYQMASKYLPISGNSGQQPSPDGTGITSDAGKAERDAPVFEVMPDRKPLVSSLVQPVPDGELMAGYAVERNTGFYTPAAKADSKMKNTIACRVDRTTTVRDNETLQLRLLESVRIGDAVIQENSLLTAQCKLAGNRMMLLVSSVEAGENIYPVKLSAYDMDGLEGVSVPGSEETDALKEIGADIGSSIGTSFTFSPSAKDQIIADAARGLMQGASDYIVRKIRTVKVTFKGGHRLMLMPAK